MWQYSARVLGVVGVGRMAVAEGHMVVVLRVDDFVAHRVKCCQGRDGGGLLWLMCTQWL